MKLFYSIFLFSTLFLLSTNHIQAQELVFITAQSGDGIHRLLQKQDMANEDISPNVLSKASRKPEMVYT